MTVKERETWARVLEQISQARSARCNLQCKQAIHLHIDIAVKKQDVRALLPIREQMKNCIDNNSLLVSDCLGRAACAPIGKAPTEVIEILLETVASIRLFCRSSPRPVQPSRFDRFATTPANGE